MQRVKVVTAYSPLPILNVSRDRFQELGKQLVDAVDCPVQVYNDWPVENCQYYRLCRTTGVAPSARNVPNDRFPDAWTMALSNIVQCQKPKWTLLSLSTDHQADVFVWIDFGIFKQQGITAKVVHDFIERIKISDPSNEIVAPGLIDQGPIDMGTHCTRFCGSIVVVPRGLVTSYFAEMDDIVLEHIEYSRTISWDVNYLACCEQDERLPFRQYKAWWDETQFTNYRITT